MAYLAMPGWWEEGLAALNFTRGITSTVSRSLVQCCPFVQIEECTPPQAPFGAGGMVERINRPALVLSKTERLTAGISVDLNGISGIVWSWVAQDGS